MFFLMNIFIHNESIKICLILNSCLSAWLIDRSVASLLPVSGIHLHPFTPVFMTDHL